MILYPTTPGNFITLQASVSSHTKSAGGALHTVDSGPAVTPSPGPSFLMFRHAEVIDSTPTLTVPSLPHYYPFSNNQVMSAGIRTTADGFAWETTFSPGSDVHRTGTIYVFNIYGIVETYTTGLLSGTGPFSFPTVSPPGENWAVVYAIHAPPGASATITPGPGITVLSLAAGSISSTGSLGLYREWSTQQGTLPVRQFTTSAPVSVRLTTFLLDTRVP